MLKLTPPNIQTFEEFIARPENAERRFEFIAGEIVEVPNNARSSEIAFDLAFFLKLHLFNTGKRGHITVDGGLYQVGDECYVPDIAYLSAERQPHLDEQGSNAIPPELAVEVVSPSDSQEDLARKVANHLSAGVVVWVVSDKKRRVDVYVPGQPVKSYQENDTLDGGEVLPGFRLPVQHIFHFPDKAEFEG